MAIFRVERQVNGVAHLVMDDPARKVTVIGEQAIADLERAVTALETDTELRGVVLMSGKPGTFVAGADVNEIAAVTVREEVHALVRRVHAVFGRIAALHCPTVAAIDGTCLGGGTELALACDSRVATEEEHTQIGLPETMLGILPGFGGTTRLPRLVGLTAALDLILTGRSVDAKKAERMGLIARAVPAAWLVEHAHRRLAELEKRPAKRRRDRFRARGFMGWFMDVSAMGRGIVLSRARSMTRARTGGHYPAPLKALDVIEKAAGKPVEQALVLEANAVSELAIGPVCKNLVRIFLLSERAKKDPPVQEPAPPALNVRTLMVVGAGVMGGGVAALASRSKIDVRLRDLSPEALTRALQTVRSLADERARKGKGGARARDIQMARILAGTELTGVRRADFALEAVVEKLDVKRRVFGELEVRLRPDAVLATNTSSLSVTELASGLARPERFCGFHFFNPVHRMPLVEVVRGRKTSDATIVTAVAFARRLGKTPVVVRDSPGFVVNRILMPYLREAMHLLEDGYPLLEIDAAMREFGMPMGPFEVLDEVGLDVAKNAAEVLTRAFPGRMTLSPILDKMVTAKRLGKKSGLGFYRHRGKERKEAPGLRRFLGLRRARRPLSRELLAERMVLAMINEAARCMEEEIVSDAGMLDLAMVFGAGFPPFRGGPLRYADSIGVAKIEGRMSAMRAEGGERFKPTALIGSLSARGGAFGEAPTRETPGVRAAS
jgi:3-hydroxyacyl-CoA dehydrogenase/enoyl-CoA hydratase/3-hydroxybutyryl-CoA epimerase